MKRAVTIFILLFILLNVAVLLGVVGLYIKRTYFPSPYQAPLSLPIGGNVIFGDTEFDEFREYKLSLPESSGEVSVIAVGDVMLARTVESQMLRHGMDYPFAQVTDLLQSGDVTFGNLETPITPGATTPANVMYFRAHPESASALARSGFSIMSLANNHMQNFGNEGVLDTLSYLDEAGVLHAGAGEDEAGAYGPAIFDVNGKTFAFFAYADPAIYGSYTAAGDTPGLAIMDQEKMTQAVAASEADYIIVSMHAGSEYTKTLTANQTDFAHTAIDAGADLVLGHHPHWVQSVEVYNGKYIFYSLGNFIFDQMWSRETQEGLAVKFIFQNGLKRFDLFPVLIENYAQPHILEGVEAEKIITDADLVPQARQIYQWDGGSITSGSIPSVLVSDVPESQLTKSFSADLDGDEVKELFTLEHGTLTINEGTQRVWQSAEEWWVDDVALADANGDGTVNINLSVWKSGSFGDSQPRWVEENDMSVKNHFFVYEMKDNELAPVWMSSNLDAPNCEFAFSDLDEDGLQDLVVIEGDYEDYPACEGRYTAIWSWNEWGFMNDWRSEVGGYADLDIIDRTIYVTK